MKPNRKVAIICALDGLANSIRPVRIKEFLEKHGYVVRLIDIKEENYLKAKEIFKHVYLGSKLKKRALGEYFERFPLAKEMEAQAQTLLFHLQRESYGTVICEDASASGVFLKEINSLKIFDCPTPRFVELENGYCLAKKNESDYKFYSQFHPEYIEELKKKELEIYKKVDQLCFHWQSYAEYVKKHFYSGDNIFVMNWGCSPKGKTAKWNKSPKTIFMGHLGNYWANKELLSFLTRISPYPIDCYGIPEPEKNYRLNYKGYLGNLNTLSKYQFGLVTISKDGLRQWGFSAKTFDYVSYGLPVLMPSWRKKTIPIGGFIYYDEENFISQIEKYSKKHEWENKSVQAHQYAQAHSWDKELQPLLDILDKFQN